MVEKFVYPPRNLPGLAEDWGRASETHANLLSKELVQQSQTMNNALRATGGQLAVIAQQVDLLGSTVTDLANRRSYTASIPPMSQTNNTTVNPTFTDQTFTLPAPEVARSAIVGFSGRLSNSGGAINSVRAFVQLTYAGTPRARGDYAVPQSLSAPVGWEETPNFFFFSRIPAGANPTFTVSLSRLGFNSTVTTLTLDNMTAFIQYGDPV